MRRVLCYIARTNFMLRRVCDLLPAHPSGKTSQLQQQPDSRRQQRQKCIHSFTNDCYRQDLILCCVRAHFSPTVFKLPGVTMLLGGSLQPGAPVCQSHSISSISSHVPPSMTRNVYIMQSFILKYTIVYAEYTMYTSHASISVSLIHSRALKGMSVFVLQTSL